MTRWIIGMFTVVLAASGCAPEHLTREELYDPANCVDCHESHVDEWQMSMHAYAADDPVFLAMNRRGQEETDGALGDFCVECHAPLAVRLGEVEDGLELEEPDFPEYLKGINCAFCHFAETADEDSNNPIELASGRAMRGPLADAVNSPAHPTFYEPMLDRGQRESSQLCGSCHDIVLENGVHLEQTFAEWKDTVFADEATLTNCGNCHMPEADTAGPIADVDGVPARFAHDHSMPGVDVAITPWPGADIYEAKVQEFLENTVRAEICVDGEPPGWRVTIGLENVSAGHSFPSGSSQDRRVWAEVKAYDGDDLIWESGVVPDLTPATDIITGPGEGVLLRDIIKDANGESVHMFWDVEQEPERNVLNGIRIFGVEEVRAFPFVGPAFTEPDRVELRVFERPIGLDVLEDLVESGHLDASFLAEMPTFELTGARLTWTGPQLGTCVTTDGSAQP